MTKEKVITPITASDFIDQAETHFNEWKDDLERLENMVNNGAGGKFRQAYSEQISYLKRYLHDVEEQLDKLKSTDSYQWEEQRFTFQQSLQKYEQAYGEAVRQMIKAEGRPAGWLEGFTDHPPAGSAGWLEGTSTRAKGSEGWVEGMAEKTLNSKGWIEGYGDKD